MLLFLLLIEFSQQKPKTNFASLPLKGALVPDHMTLFVCDMCFDFNGVKVQKYSCKLK